MTIANFGEIGRIKQDYRVTKFSRVMLPGKEAHLNFVLDVLKEEQASKCELIA